MVDRQTRTLMQSWFPKMQSLSPKKTATTRKFTSAARPRHSRSGFEITRNPSPTPCMQLIRNYQSTCAWSLKEKNKEYNIKWDIVKQVPSYKSGGKQCSLCSNEKLYILKAEKGSILNKRSELFSRCIHQRRFLAGRFNRANSTSARKKPT